MAPSSSAMRLTWTWPLLAALICSYPAWSDPTAFSIPAGEAAVELKDFARQSGLQLLFDFTAVKAIRTRAISGQYEPEVALTEMLRDSGLGFERVNAQTIAIRPIPRPATDSGAGAIIGAPGKTVRSPAAVPFAEPSVGLEEIVVTAQKRSERLQDVPVPVSVLSPETLVGENQSRLQDYYSQIPGFNVAPIGFQSTQVLSIRGINTGLAGNPSVGITVDDVPFGASTNAGGGVTVPDFDPGDLARVEVLRGPQGTLYGASSLGGLLKFVTVDPSTDALFGRLEAGTSGVYHGNEPGYSFRGSINVPVSDSFAIRASAFTRRDPGYIDNPVQHIDGINEDQVSGGRLSALWRPVDSISLKLSAIYQDTSGWSSDIDQATNGYVGPPLGDLQQNYIPGVGGYNRKVQAYSATLDAKLGAMDLTSVTGYNINAYHDSWDYSVPFGVGVVQLAFPNATGAPFTDDNKTRKFSQELRLSSPIGQKLDWLVGAFYTREQSTYASSIIAADADTGSSIGTALAYSYPTTYKEYAGFADVTYHFTDQFDIQVGGRVGHIEQAFTEFFSGPLASPTIPETTVVSTPATYLFTPEFKFSPDLMLYARLASGYRAGGTNGQVVPDPRIPIGYEPDKTFDYELGLKGDAVDHRITFDASVYYIAWKNIQLTLQCCNTSYISNAGRAKSQGIELSIQTKPLDGLTVSAWATWNDAALKEGFPPNSSTYGVAGDRLPYTSRFSGNLSADEDFPLTSQWRGFVGATAIYVGDRAGEFTSAPPAPPPRQDYPGYAQVNFRTGVKSDSWTVNVFATNLFDRRALLGGGLGSFPPYGFTLIQPRTVGVNVVKTF
jgi:iron complex outermembrane recepter protein